MNGREDGSRSSFRTVAALMAIPVAGLAIFFLWNWINGGRPSIDVKPPQTPVVQAGTITEPALPVVTRRKRGDIVLIIDDLGFDGQHLDRVMALDPNVNCSILPNGTRAEEYAETLHRAGFEILCHLPMEPVGHESPGRDAILTSMTDDEIARLTRENFDAIPYARGVNNHMGSRATADRRVMTTVIGALPRGIYFIDSRTASGSIAATVAHELKVRTATRNVFLDDVATDAAVRKQLDALASAAEKHGTAIGIGHPHAVTVRVLTEELPRLRERGFRFVRASEVVR
jgi:polysaccharide deacetylase 2 family uncharacterized protein YibQ